MIIKTGEIVGGYAEGPFEYLSVTLEVYNKEDKDNFDFTFTKRGKNGRKNIKEVDTFLEDVKGKTITIHIN